MQSVREGEDAELSTLIAHDPVEGGRQAVEALARRHGITIDWRESRRMPTGILGRANVAKRKIMLPQFEAGRAPNQLAVALHEIGHVLATQDCPARVPPHQRVWKGGCLECERLAWARALELWPFSDPMFAMLQTGLAEAIAQYPAPAEAIAAARALTRLATLTEHRTRRQRFQAARARQEAVRQSFHADAARFGQLACVVTGCRQPSAMLDAGDPICQSHHIDRRIAAQRRQAAAMRPS